MFVSTLYKIIVMLLKINKNLDLDFYLGINQGCECIPSMPKTALRVLQFRDHIGMHSYYLVAFQLLL